MKKLIYIAAALTINAGIYAQTDAAAPVNTVNTNTESVDASTTPEAITKHFNNDYPNEIATWHKDGDNYKAYYIDSQTKLRRTVVYDKNGNDISEDYELEYNEIPYGIVNYYSSTSKQDNNYHVWERETNKGEIVYVSKMDGKTAYFDKNGKPMSAKPTMVSRQHKKSANK